MNLHFANDPNIVQTLRDYIDRRIIAFGRPEYTYMALSKKDPLDMFMISSYPDEWMDIYRTQNLQNIDPVILSSFKRISPFVWNENITVISDIKLTKIFSLSKEHNVTNGFTFILHDYLNNLVTLSITVNHETEEKIEDKVIQNRDAFQLLLIEIHEKMLMLNQKSSFYTRTKKSQDKEILFTPRENEVFYWASMGKTYPEIGLITGISPRTVKFHMGNVIKKLGVLNSRQAIRLGIELGLVDFEP